MGLFVRKARTASGATAVQIMFKSGDVCRIMEHLGSTHGETELEVLLEAGRQKTATWQGQGLSDLGSLELAPGRTGPATTTVKFKRSRLSWVVLHDTYQRPNLGEAIGGDRAFEQMVLTRLVELSSKAQVPQVLSDLGPKTVAVWTLFRSPARAREQGYCGSLSGTLFGHVTASRGLALCLYGVTTFRFGAEKEDNLQRVGYSKERRVDSQVIMSLLIDRHGFPLRIECREGNKAETTTIILIVEVPQAARGVEGLVVVTDADMFSAADLTALDDARLRFIVGARQVRAPGDLGAHFYQAGDVFTDEQLIDIVTSRRDSNTERDKSLRTELIWDPDTHPRSWRAVWAYSKRYAARDTQTLIAQADHARVVIAGGRCPEDTRFVTVHRGDQVLDEASLARARSLVDLRGYVANIPSCLMDAGEMVSPYRELWHTEQSFRMSKHGLRARPVFHHTRDTIEAHLVMVIAALAVARHVQEIIGISIRRIIHTLRPLQNVIINLNGHKVTARSQVTPTAANISRPLQSPGH